MASTSYVLATLVAIMERGKPDAARVAAATALLDRGWGKATQVIETPGLQPIVFHVPVGVPAPTGLRADVKVLPEPEPTADGEVELRPVRPALPWRGGAR